MQLEPVGKDFDLSAVDTRATPGFTGDKAEGQAELDAHAHELDELQEILLAESRHGGTRSVLLVLQAMDTAGKGGIVHHVVGRHRTRRGEGLTAFKAPTEEEQKHDFLWRVRKQLPPPGIVGVFDRSHYEQVLIHRVRDLDAQGRDREELRHDHRLREGAHRRRHDDSSR